MPRQYNDESRAMEEAALLPQDDPRRRAFVEALEDSGADHRAWCEALARNEDLRLRLLGVDTPAELTERIRAVRGPEVCAPRSRQPAFVGAILAATVLIAITVGLFASRHGTPADTAVYELAKLAAADHATLPGMTVETNDLGGLSLALGDSLPFDIAIKSPQPGAELLGGRLCSFGDRPIVYTRWRTEDGEVAVYQMEHQAFGLGPGLQPVDIGTSQIGSSGSPCNVRVWSDDSFAYVAVEDRPVPGG